MLLGDTHLYAVPAVTRIQPQKGKKEKLCVQHVCHREIGVTMR